MDDHKTIDFSKSYPHYRAYRPFRLRWINRFLALSWMFLAIWIVIASVIVSSVSDDEKGGAIFGVIFGSMFFSIVTAVVQFPLRGIRTAAEAKWKQYHSDVTEQIKVRALIKTPETSNENTSNDIWTREMMTKHPILFLAANPLDSTVLRLSEEAREIREELERAGLRDKFLFHERGAVRPKDLSRTLLELAPRYLHFSGHGGPSGAIYLEDEAGKSTPVSAKALGAVFRASGNHIHCVLLNACYSRTQAEEILTCVPFVIGMKDTIGDRAAITFARGFYRAIGAGRDVPNAFDFGIAELLINSIPEDAVPTLLQR